MTSAAPVGRFNRPPGVTAISAIGRIAAAIAGARMPVTASGRASAAAPSEAVALYATEPTTPATAISDSPARRPHPRTLGGGRRRAPPPPAQPGATHQAGQPPRPRRRDSGPAGPRAGPARAGQPRRP